MAVKNIAIYNRTNDGMALPLSITRGNPNPLDDTALYATLSEAKTYATTGSTAYVGQLIVVLNTDITGGEPTAYVIADAAGNLKAVGSSDAVFDSDDWANLKSTVEKLDNSDDTTEGSLARVASESKITIKLDSTTSSGTNYDVYQGYTYTTEQAKDAGGNLLYEADGVTAKMTTVKTPVKIGTIGIAADLFVSGGSVVTVEANSTVDSEGDACSVSEGKYLKLKLSNGNSVYISTQDLGGSGSSSFQVKIDSKTFESNTSGVVEITEISTDVLKNGDDQLILNGGSAAV